MTYSDKVKIMTYSDKVKILNEIFENIEMIDEKDKPSIIAYIRGTSDTRERIVLENKAKGECTKKV